MEKQKIEAMAARYQKARKRICLFFEKVENYESDTRDITNPDQTNNDKNLLQL